MMQVRKGMILAAAVAVCVAAERSICRAAPNSTAAAAAGGNWPAVQREHKPWSYWWWMGSAVEKAELTRHLEMYSRAGYGGVHIIPIYGAEGWEDRYIQYLSPKWMEMLAYTVAEAQRFGMGVDMSCGTGWPFGGPNVRDEDADACVGVKTYTLGPGDKLTEKIDRHKLQKLMAYSAQGARLDLTDQVDGDGVLNWQPAEGQWELYAVCVYPERGRKVKRAAPGGEGNSVNPFSKRALKNYLVRFDEAFAQYRGTMVRAFYHDSYEYLGDWSDQVFEEFAARRGYRLQDHLPALLGKGPGELATRVRADFRATMAEMLLDNLIKPWVQWAHGKGALTRNQAHGSPGNILDLYAAADIPETEAYGTAWMQFGGLEIPQGMFRTVGGDIPDQLVNKMASSAAHVAGKPRVASEACTWLSDHFRVSLAEAKASLDVQFTLGVNHVTWHGMAYSPQEAGWPGWMFYAETNFGPSNTFWRDLPAFTSYVARCQSFLQSGRPDNDVLLYFPIYDVWAAEPEDHGLLLPLQVHNSDVWLRKAARGCHLAATAMWDLGYSFDFVSDLQLKENVSVAGARLTAGGASYRCLVIPAVKNIPPQTLERIAELARQGATVLFTKQLPGDVPGLANLEPRRVELKRILAELEPNEELPPAMRSKKLGQGRLLLGSDLQTMLELTGMRREALVDLGLEFIRRATEDGWIYFVNNPGRKQVDQWISLSAPAGTVVFFDPLFGGRGLADTRGDKGGLTQVYLQLAPGESLIIRACPEKLEGPRWTYSWPAGMPVEVPGQWDVSFLEGGPALPKPIKLRQLESWTELDPTDAGAPYRAFSGTARYSLTFDKPAAQADDWLLDLGRVCHNAQVKLNGQSLGTLFAQPYRLRLGEALKDGPNQLEIEVTNLPANRIIDMERRKEPWCKYLFFYINRAGSGPADWHSFPSGLLGPVRVIPLCTSARR